MAWLSLLSANYFLILASLSSIKCVPEISLLTRKVDSVFNYYCVIGYNDVHLPTVILPESAHALNLGPESEYLTPEGDRVPKEHNYEFEEAKYNYLQNFTNNAWEIVPSENHLLQLTKDIRFEKLKIYTTQDSSISFKTEKDFYFPFSVRAEKEPQIIFCGESNSDHIECYWIRIEKYLIAIRFCPLVHKKKFDIDSSGCYRVASPQLKNDTKLNLDWLHFIAIRNGDILTLKNGFNNENYDTIKNVTLNIKKIYLSTSDSYRGEWKIHKNSYLKLKTFETEIQLGPTFTLKNNMKFCISMLVSICDGCSLEIRINNGEKKIFYSSSEIWQHIKMVDNNTNKKEYKIFVRGLKKNNGGTIAIDNIRLCHENEIRLLKASIVSSDEDETPKVFCKSLIYSTWYAGSSAPNNSIQVCDDPKYIGNNCDLPCSTIFGKGPDMEFCNKNLICKPSENINEQTCTCASGYMGTNCEETCSLGNFGYNCKERCGKCKNTKGCLKSSGICPQGCDDDYLPDKCLYKNCFATSNKNGLINITWTASKASGNSFKILVEQSDSDTPSNFSKHVNVVTYKRNNKQYTYIINQLPHSSTYKIKVCKKNTDDCTVCNVTTPPIPPKLEENFIFLEYTVDDTKIIRIPGIVANTINKNSTMYVTVCNQTSEMIYIQKTKYATDRQILSKIGCARTSWIAGKLKTNTSEVFFTVGEGKKSANIYENPSLQNIYYNKYNICVVAVNEYDNLSSFNVYCEFDDGYDPFINLVVGATILGVLLLGIIIFLTICGIKSCKNKNTETQDEGQDNPESEPMNSNIQNEAPANQSQTSSL